MKRKLLAVGLLFFVVILSSAQSYNPYVNQAIISPAPLLPLEFNGTGIASFNIGNTYASDMPLVQNKENTLKISLSKGEPDNPNPVLAVGGTWKNYFNWSYNSSTKTFTAVQNNTLPGAPAVGTITIAYKVTENSNISQINNGFLVNIQPNPDYNGNGNQLADDEAGSYTYVQAVDYGDAPASYDSYDFPVIIDTTRHEINIFKEAVTGISGVRYTKYIYLGTSVDPETKSEYAPTINADGDDIRGSDDENGVTIPRLIRGKTVTIPVVVTKVEKSSGKLYAFIDWAANGDFFDAGELITPETGIDIPRSTFTPTNNAIGKIITETIYITVTVPANAPLGYTYARFRVGTDVGGAPFGSADYGEVEDYKVLVEENVCAWRTIASGNWTTTTPSTIWEYFDCETNTWKTSTVAPNNDKPIYVLHEVTIPAGSEITADSLYIQPTGQLNACGNLTIDNEIAFVLDANGNPGELNNCGCPGGTVELNPTARKIVHRPAGSTWSFMSFPFNVSEQNIFLSGAKVYNVADVNDNFSYTTTDPATWGDDLTTIGADFYAVEYDGQKQATDNAAGTSSSNFVNVTGTAGSRVLEAMKGYLIANSRNNLQAIDFTSALGEDFKFCTNVTKNLTFYTASGAEPCSEGWNFVGLPYVASYDLRNTSSNGTYYVYIAPDYETVVSGDNNIVYPFSAYFVKVPSTQNLLYATSGQQLIKGVSRSANMDEISLVLMYGNNMDRTRIRLQENAVNGFIYTEDAYKMMSASATFPQIYTQIEGQCANIDVNALPENTQQVQLKIRTGVKGLYTIKLTDAEKAGGISKAILVDKLTGLRTDLLIENSYTFEVTETGESDRFMILFAKDGTTDMPLGNEDGIFVTVKGSKISLKGLKGKAHVNMYDVVGKLLYQYKDIKNNQNFNVYVPGVYLMDIVTETQSIRYKVLIDNND